MPVRSRQIAIYCELLHVCNPGILSCAGSGNGVFTMGSSLLRRIAELLGLRTLPKSAIVVAAMARNRLAPQALKHLAAAGMRGEDLAFIIPPRTLSHRIARNERLSVEESDRALRLARTVALADIVFGEHAKALDWLRVPKKQFKGRCALEMVRTEAGARLVDELLTRIDEGYFA